MNNPILDLSFKFALDVIEYSEMLEEKRSTPSKRQRIDEIIIQHYFFK